MLAARLASPKIVSGTPAEPRQRHLELGSNVELRGGALLVVLFVVSRVVLSLAGLEFNLDLGWMFLADPAWLRDEPLTTIYYFHAFPPGMNVITAALLQFGDAALLPGARLLFWACGLLICLSVFYLARAISLGRRAAIGLAFAFSICPPSLWLENLYLYDYPTTALLAVAAVLFHRAVVQPSTRRWMWFFLVCAVIGWIRSVFHLAWFVVMFGLALAAVRTGERRRVLAAVVLPLAVLLSLYLKNYVVFGVFGTTSWGGSNLTTVTTEQLSKEDREAWIARGELSPYASTSVFAEPSTYLRRYPELRLPGPSPWPHADDVRRPTVGVGNYNHRFYLIVNAHRRKDSSQYLRERPWAYLRTAASKGLVKVLQASTRWHPHDEKPTSPHHRHRQVLGGYERVYNAIVHTVPVPTIGLYALLPIVLAFGLVRGFRRGRAVDRTVRAEGLLAMFFALQIGYVITISSLFTVNECSRYRYLVECFIWLLTAQAIVAAVGRWRARA